MPFKASDRRSDQVAPRFTFEALLGACGMRLYDAGLRVSELVVIEVTHIEPGNEEGSGLLHLPRSKANQMGEGALPGCRPTACGALAPGLSPVESLTGRCSAGLGSIAGRHVPHRRGVILPISPPNPLICHGETGIIRRVGRAAADAGLVDLMGDALVAALAALSSRSLRLGLTQDLFAAGEDPGPISPALRWSSPPTALRYACKLAPSRNAAARVLRNLRG